jgi:salicylate 5-hydroxylase small subunit
MYAPRLIRRMVTGIRIIGWTGDTLEVHANFASFETLTDALTRVFIVGGYRDKIAVVDGKFRFQEKLCVFDSMLVPNSLIYPL